MSDAWGEIFDVRSWYRRFLAEILTTQNIYRYRSEELQHKNQLEQKYSEQAIPFELEDGCLHGRETATYTGVTPPKRRAQLSSAQRELRLQIAYDIARLKLRSLERSYD